MKGTSEVIMGATLIMVLSLAIVLGLVLVLLAELYCSLLVRRPTTTLEDATAVAPTPSQSQNQSSSVPPPSLGHFYSHGVLNAPRSFLFPSLSFKEDDKIQHSRSQLGQLLESSQPPQHSHATASAAQVRILSSSQPSPNSATESKIEAGEDADGSRSSKEHEHLVYISNPIFDDCIRATTTPYVTPDTSPSHLGNTSGSSSDEDENKRPSPVAITPPLSPMKELSAEACSVSMKDARCLNTSGSDSHSINDGGSTSSSGTPCTSPSW